MIPSGPLPAPHIEGRPSVMVVASAPCRVNDSGAARKSVGWSPPDGPLPIESVGARISRSTTWTALLPSTRSLYLPAAAGRSHWSLTRVLLYVVELSCCLSTVTLAPPAICRASCPDE